MNKHKFIEYLRKPADLQEPNLAELESIIAEYPYFQSARTLLAKASKTLKNEKAPRHVGSAAVYATDRILLKRYINGELIFLNPVEVHESHEAERDRDLGEVIKSSRIEARQAKLPTPPPKPKPQEPQPAAQKETPATPKAERPKEAAITQKPEVINEQAPKTSHLDQLIKELYQDMEELKANREKFREYENKLAEEEAVEDAVKRATSKTATEKPKPASESRSARGNKPTAKTPAETKPQPKAESTTTRKAPAAKAKKTTSKKTDDSTEQPKAEKKDDKGEPRRVAKQDEIIAEFIKKSPSIPPADSTRKNDTDLSGDSTVLHPEIASEYLAQIYLEQGKKERAIQIYEALVVKFPEKSVYFAEIINNLT